MNPVARIDAGYGDYLEHARADGGALPGWVGGGHGGLLIGLGSGHPTLVTGLLRFALRVLFRNCLALGLLLATLGFFRRRLARAPAEDAASANDRVYRDLRDVRFRTRDAPAATPPAGPLDPDDDISWAHTVRTSTTTTTSSVWNNGEGADSVHTPAGAVTRRVTESVGGCLRAILDDHHSVADTEVRLVQFADCVLAMLKAALQHLDVELSEIWRKSGRTEAENRKLARPPVSDTVLGNHLNKRCRDDAGMIYLPPHAPSTIRRTRLNLLQNASKSIVLSAARMAGSPHEGGKWFREAALDKKSPAIRALFDLYSGVLKCVDVDIHIPGSPSGRYNVYERLMVTMFGHHADYRDVMAACAHAREGRPVVRVSRRPV